MISVSTPLPAKPCRKPCPSPSTKSEDAVLMNKMIVANLVYRPLRSAISMVAVAVEVTLILLIVGLSTGILNDNKTRQAGIGADIMVKPPGPSFMTALTDPPVPTKPPPLLRQHTPPAPAPPP